MSAPTHLAELRVRLLQATGPDRELDVDIECCLIGDCKPWGDGVVSPLSPPKFGPSDCRFVKRYTASIDAAVALAAKHGVRPVYALAQHVINGDNADATPDRLARLVCASLIGALMSLQSQERSDHGQ